MKKSIIITLLLFAILSVLNSSVQADIVWEVPVNNGQAGTLPLLPVKPVYPETEDCCSISGCIFQDVFAKTLDDYYQAVSEQWEAGRLSEAGFCFMIADIYGDKPLENIGYAITDFDNDGVCELIIGVMPSIEDDFFSKMIFAMYAKDNDGQLVPVFTSWDRNRHYYAGSDRFANIGSSSAFDSVDTTMQYKGQELHDLGYATSPADYEYPPLQPLSEWK